MISTLISSSVVALGADVITGASLTGVTLKVKLPLSVYSPSVTATSIIIEPLKFVSGASVSVLPSISTVPLPSILAVYIKSSPSISLADNV